MSLTSIPGDSDVYAGTEMTRTRSWPLKNVDNGRYQACALTIREAGNNPCFLGLLAKHWEVRLSLWHFTFASFSPMAPDSTFWKWEQFKFKILQRI